MSSLERTDTVDGHEALCELVASPVCDVALLQARRAEVERLTTRCVREKRTPCVREKRTLGVLCPLFLFLVPFLMLRLSGAAVDASLWDYTYAPSAPPCREFTPRTWCRCSCTCNPCSAPQRSRASSVSVRGSLRPLGSRPSFASTVSTVSTVKTVKTAVTRRPLRLRRRWRRPWST